MRSLKRKVRQLNWISTHTSSNTSYEVLQLSYMINNHKIGNLIQTNKCITKLGMMENKLKYPDLGDTKKV